MGIEIYNCNIIFTAFLYDFFEKKVLSMKLPKIRKILTCAIKYLKILTITHNLQTLLLSVTIILKTHLTHLFKANYKDGSCISIDEERRPVPHQRQNTAAVQQIVMTSTICPDGSNSAVFT